MLRIFGRRHASVILLLAAVTTPGAAQIMARPSARVASAAAPGKPSTLSTRRSCMIEKELLLPSNALFDNGKWLGARFTNDGITIDVKKGKQVMLAYTDIVSAILQTTPKRGSRIDLVMANRKRHSFWFTDVMTGQEQRLQLLETAMTTLSQAAGHAPPFVCSDSPADYAAELDLFQRDTAGWRGLSTKPPLNDEAYKDRLLAEDAMKSRNMTVALKYYEDGVIADPTWAQGWYNAAVVYSEMGDEFDAALCMKHYVVLLPEAADIRTAKDNIILWETKAAAKRSAATEVVPAASFRRR